MEFMTAIILIVFFSIIAYEKGREKGTIESRNQTPYPLPTQSEFTENPQKPLNITKGSLAHLILTIIDKSENPSSFEQIFDEVKKALPTEKTDLRHRTLWTVHVLCNKGLITKLSRGYYKLTQEALIQLKN